MPSDKAFWDKGSVALPLSMGLPVAHQDIIDVPPISGDACIGKELPHDEYRGLPRKGAQIHCGLSPGGIDTREGGYLCKVQAIVRGDPDIPKVKGVFEVKAVPKGQRRH